MKNSSNKNCCVIGMVGLGVMGRNLLLNMAEHGFQVAGYDLDKNKVASLKQGSKAIHATNNIAEFINQLCVPRAVMLLVPAGAAVDAAVKEILPYLQKGDIIIDGGNSHFTDTDRRINELQKKGINFLGIGISGGEEGARRGPSIMPGGSEEAYEHVRGIFEAVAAKVNNEPCVKYLGKGAAGHYVKMVHNGIEYALMQLIAETYDIMKRGLGLSDNQLQNIYSKWNETRLNSYLIEITSQIFKKIDEKTGKHLIDKIKSVAQQKGTGMWTSQSAMELQVPVPTIDLAVEMRDLSVLTKQREQANSIYCNAHTLLNTDQKTFLKQLEDALYSAMIIAYAQGMALLSVASTQYQFQLNLENIAKIWRGGCIIRAKLLEDFSQAYHLNKNLPNLLLDPNISKQVKASQENLRKVISQSSLTGIATPALMVSLAYFDAYRSKWLPANLIQAQRDYFGSHNYERTDETGSFHTEWEEDLTK